MTIIIILKIYRSTNSRRGWTHRLARNSTMQLTTQIIRILRNKPDAAYRMRDRFRRSERNEFHE